MIDPELQAKLEEITRIAERAAVAAEKTRKYLFWTGVVTAILVVLPAIGLVFAIPQFINTYTSALGGLGY